MLRKNSFSFFHSLKAQLLLAMPCMDDPRFQKSVIFLCVHEQNGAMGLSINNTQMSLRFPSLLKQVGIDTAFLPSALVSLPVMQGGPVEENRGFLLHSNDFVGKDTIQINDQFCVSGTVDTLHTVAAGTLPRHMLFTLGYVGWSAGQLDQEMASNVWMSVPATYDLVFNTPADQMWSKAYGSLGVDPRLLSMAPGSA